MENEPKAYSNIQDDQQNIEIDMILNELKETQLNADLHLIQIPEGSRIGSIRHHQNISSTRCGWFYSEELGIDFYPTFLFLLVLFFCLFLTMIFS